MSIVASAARDKADQSLCFETAHYRESRLCGWKRKPVRADAIGPKRLRSGPNGNHVAEDVAR